jgi:solute carrier family 27 (fatty acid transporter), member 1/4
MKEEPMKTALTTAEKIVTLAGITLSGTMLSSLIGRHFIPQSLLTALVLWLLTGRRPTVVFGTCQTLGRDLM